MSKCSPHTWRIPLVGEQALTCSTCGRRLDFLDMPPHARRAILGAVERRESPGYFSVWRSGFFDALTEARNRHNEVTQ